MRAGKVKELTVPVNRRRWLRVPLGGLHACRHVPLVVAIALLGACGTPYEIVRGEVMGTYFRIVASCERAARSEATAEAVAALHAANDAMTTYSESSALMRLNRAKAGEWQRTDPEVVRVIKLAREIGSRANGAYDVTIGALVRLWGFGGGEQRSEPPSRTAVAALLADVGDAMIEIEGRDRVRRLGQTTFLDLSSIAKGDAVDRAVAALDGRCRHFLVDVGGELRAQGVNAQGRAWRVGVERPSSLPGAEPVQAILSLSEGAVATSGDYRNVLSIGGRTFSHAIDPRTGYPVEHGLASVTVVARSAARADAWATALLVLGPTEGWRVAREHALAAYFIERTESGFRTRYTSELDRYLSDEGTL